MTTSRRLLPPERAFVSWLSKRQALRPSPTLQRMRADNGDEATTLFCLAGMWAVPALLASMVGAALIVASRTDGSLGQAGFALTNVGTVLLLVGGFRWRQASREQRRFRGSRQ
jgi:hypothetical protein